MRILMLSPSYPVPENDGAKRRISAFAHRLGANHELTLVGLRDLSQQDPERNGHDTRPELSVPWRAHVVDTTLSPRQAAVRSVFSSRSYRELRFSSAQFAQKVRCLLDPDPRKGAGELPFDLVWVNFLTMSGYIEQLIGARRRPVLVLDQHNVDEMVWRSLGRGRPGRLSWLKGPAWRAYGALQVAKLRRYQRCWYPRYDLILSVSSEDVALTRAYTGSDRVLLAPNGVDIDYFRPGPEPDEGLRLVFGASMDVSMNQDAAIWFFTRVLPLIRLHIPDVEFWIVGRNPPASIASLSRIPGVTVTGTVDDVRKYYRSASVFVVPSRMGGGTKLKTLEGMAMALPVVATSVGAQGLNVRSGQHLYVAETADEFAVRTVELLRDRELAASMGAASRRLVESQYSWDHIVGDVEARLERLVVDQGDNRKRSG